MLAFINPDKSAVVIAGNDGATDKTIHISVNGTFYSPTLKANSLNTLVIK
ncbi:MAG: hypothetical protein LBJ60_06685 [Tannerellaceae bacterium]|nr:hypothetical protein [Tannerellaceae bacterium]